MVVKLIPRNSLLREMEDFKLVYPEKSDTLIGLSLSPSPFTYFKRAA